LAAGNVGILRDGAVGPDLACGERSVPRDLCPTPLVSGYPRSGAGPQVSVHHEHKQSNNAGQRYQAQHDEKTGLDILTR
jgi:hypothetical protein